MLEYACNIQERRTTVSMFHFVDEFPIWAKLIADVVSVEDDQLVSNQFPVRVMVITQTRMR